LGAALTGAARMTGTEQVVISIIATVVSGVLVYWLTVGVRRRRIRVVGKTSDISPQKPESELTPKHSAENDEQKKLLGRLAIALNMSAGNDKNQKLEQLIQTFLSRGDVASAKKAAAGLTRWDSSSTGTRQDYAGKWILAKWLFDQDRFEEAEEVVETLYYSSDKSSMRKRLLD
jgi:hypothetical protein